VAPFFFGLMLVGVEKEISRSRGIFARRGSVTQHCLWQDAECAQSTRSRWRDTSTCTPDEVHTDINSFFSTLLFIMAGTFSYSEGYESKGRALWLSARS